MIAASIVRSSVHVGVRGVHDRDVVVGDETEHVVPPGYWW